VGNKGIAKDKQNESTIKKRPNVLFILTDDQRYNTIHALGNNEIETPAIDKLVEKGVTFTYTFYMGALTAPVCMPSRAMLLTGKNLFSIRQDGSYIPEAHITMPEYFRINGYETFGTGKWHQDKESFNRSFSAGDNIFLGGMHSYKTNGHFEPILHHYDESGIYNQPFVSDNFSSVCFTNATIDFIRTYNSEKPFFVYVSFTSPHDPRTPPNEYGKKYRPDDVSLPDNFLPEHPFDNGALNIRAESLIPFPRTEQDVKTEIAKYYGMISEVDFQIQRIIDVLKENGKIDNTIIVFTSDNGLAVGQHGLLAKQNQYEHSIRIPLIISGPGIPTNQKRNSYVYIHGLFATLCDLVGLNIPRTVETKSFKKIIFNPNEQWRKKVLTCYSDKQRAIRYNEFKLIAYNINGVSRVQLFNLIDDPWELNDLSIDPKYEKLKNDLLTDLKKEMMSANDFCDLDKNGWGYPKNLTQEQLKNINP
jgi:arylsulfatase A-like enzyme